MSFLRNGSVTRLCHLFSLMSHVAYKKRLCPMSLHSPPSPPPHVACHLALCRMSSLRNAHVALSILGFRGHTGPPLPLFEVIYWPRVADHSSVKPFGEPCSLKRNTLITRLTPAYGNPFLEAFAQHLRLEASSRVSDQYTTPPGKLNSPCPIFCHIERPKKKGKITHLKRILQTSLFCISCIKTC